MKRGVVVSISIRIHGWRCGANNEYTGIGMLEGGKLVIPSRVEMVVRKGGALGFDGLGLIVVSG